MKVYLLTAALVLSAAMPAFSANDEVRTCPLNKGTVSLTSVTSTQERADESAQVSRIGSDQGIRESGSRPK